MYDTKTEATVKGTVQEVKTATMMGGAGWMGMQGIHVLLKTDAEIIEVHLGPSAFMQDMKLEIAQGDVVEVLGSRVAFGESVALIAREVRKGGMSWTLRDTNGRPVWRLGC
jgi:hypothetical protein